MPVKIHPTGRAKSHRSRVCKRTLNKWQTRSFFAQLCARSPRDERNGAGELIEHSSNAKHSIVELFLPLVDHSSPYRSIRHLASNRSIEISSHPHTFLFDSIVVSTLIHPVRNIWTPTFSSLLVDSSAASSFQRSPHHPRLDQKDGHLWS